MLNKKPKKTKKIVKTAIMGLDRRTKAGKFSLKIPYPSALEKFFHNPIIVPRQENSWENHQTFNPGAILLGDKVHFIYRAIGSDGVSRFGYASSRDGFKIDERLSYPVFQHQPKERFFNIFSYFSGGSWGGAEDPRIVRVGQEDKLYMTYTACVGGLRVGLTSIKIDDFLNKRWKWELPVLISPPGEVHKNWVIFPEKIKGQYAVLHSVSPEVSVDYFDNLEFDDSAYIESYYASLPRKSCWDKWLRGVGPVPVKTEYGWLVFYHAMDNDWSKYKVGAMLLDLQNPSKILFRSRRPVLEPDEQYEFNGFKGGVVYASGAVVKNGELLLYYGAADSFICAARANFDEFLERMRKDKEPKLKRV